MRGQMISEKRGLLILADTGKMRAKSRKIKLDKVRLGESGNLFTVRVKHLLKGCGGFFLR